MSIRTFISMIALGAGAVMAVPVMAQEYTLTVSLDTSPQHVRNTWMKEVAREVAERSEGRLALEIFEAASKYKDSEAAAAVAQGAVDMAMPQYQLVSRFVPDCDFEQLPMFYGMGLEEIYKVSDGEPGEVLAQKIEDKLGVVVLGRPIDLGLHTVFSRDVPLNSPSDLEGLKVRIPGGPASTRRFEAMGASPVQIAWPDVPQALQTGVVGVIWSTHESIASAQLWDAGLRYALDDNQSINQYVPLMNRRSLEALPEDLREILETTWEEMVDLEREQAAKRQDEARERNAENGIKTVTPDPADLAEMRARLMQVQPALVEELGMDPEFVELVRSYLPE